MFSLSLALLEDFGADPFPLFHPAHVSFREKRCHQISEF